MSKSPVFFTSIIDEDQLVQIFRALNKELPGRVAVKTHSGEPGGHNYLQPTIIKKLVQELQATIVECNTAYRGQRFETVDHLQVMKDHGFADIAPVDIMDSEGEWALPVKNGQYLQENYVGDHLKNYDSLLVLSHFKGHIMGGFGGALKNISIGIASGPGKAYIHSAGRTKDRDKSWEIETPQNEFLASMAEASQTIMDFAKGQIAFINVMNNISIDCDCVPNPSKPCMHDIGMLASLDPVALDQACLDLVYQSQNQGKEELLERIKSRNGDFTVDYAQKIGVGSKDYELINLDQNK